jgi:hypothetical protein
MFSKNKLYPLASAIIFIMVLYSCSNDPVVENKRPFEGYGLWMDTVLKSADKAVRGLEPGMTYQEVKKLETLLPTEEDSASLYYEIKADSITNAALTYSFVDGRLGEIELLVTTKTLERGAAVFNDLKNYFDKKYPGGLMQKGIYVYSGTAADGGSYKISLEDRSGLEDGQINVLVYRE